MDEEIRIRSLLEEEIRTEFKNLEFLEIGSQEYSSAVDVLVKLYKLKIEEDVNAIELLEKNENQKKDREFKTAQLAETIKDRYFRVGIAGAELVLPLIFYGIWMRQGFRFEKEGVFTSQTFRNLFSRFRPTKK